MVYWDGRDVLQIQISIPRRKSKFEMGDFGS
jgi:hypothetical protein